MPHSGLRTRRNVHADLYITCAQRRYAGIKSFRDVRTNHARLSREDAVSLRADAPGFVVQEYGIQHLLGPRIRHQ